MKRHYNPFRYKKQCVRVNLLLKAFVFFMQWQNKPCYCKEIDLEHCGVRLLELVWSKLTWWLQQTSIIVLSSTCYVALRHWIKGKRPMLHYRKSPTISSKSSNTSKDFKMEILEVNDKILLFLLKLREGTWETKWRFKVEVSEFEFKFNFSISWERCQRLYILMKYWTHGEDTNFTYK